MEFGNANSVFLIATTEFGTLTSLNASSASESDEDHTHFFIQSAISLAVAP